jgi:hypothetical protein
MASRRITPPWDFLHKASSPSLESFELSRLNHTANLRKEIAALLEQWIAEAAEALLARWVREDRQLLPQPVDPPDILAQTELPFSPPESIAVRPPGTPFAFAPLSAFAFTRFRIAFRCVSFRVFSLHLLTGIPAPLFASHEALRPIRRSISLRHSFAHVGHPLGPFGMLVLPVASGRRASLNSDTESSRGIPRASFLSFICMGLRVIGALFLSAAVFACYAPLFLRWSLWPG